MLRELLRALLIVCTVVGGFCWLQAQYPATSNPFDDLRVCIVDLDCSRDGTTLLSRSKGQPDDCSPLVLHFLNREPPARALWTGETQLVDAALPGDASAALVLGDSGGLQRIDLRSLESRQLCQIPVAFDVKLLAVSTDGLTAALATSTEITLRDALTGAVQLRLNGHTSTINDMVFSDDGTVIASASDDGTVRIWNSLSGECRRVLSTPKVRFMRVRFVDGGRKLVTTNIALGWGNPGSICLWDDQTFEPLWQVSDDRLGALALAVTPDGTLAATGGFDRKINLWDLNKRACVGSLAGHAGTLRSLHFSPDGTTLVSAAEDGAIRFWNVRSRSLMRTIDVGKISPR
ncbi:MAG: WD40 repeat domain-containing protein [Planctomycetaceae bacterium]